jgi:hypothetical protein
MPRHVYAHTETAFVFSAEVPLLASVWYLISHPFGFVRRAKDITACIWIPAWIVFIERILNATSSIL